MAQVRQMHAEGTLAPFIIISTLLHILFVILYPQWEASPIQSSIPGSGVLQFTLREAPQARFVSLQPVVLPANTPQPQARPASQPASPQPQIQPQQPPQQVAQATVTTAQAQVAAVPAAQVPTPQARPQPSEPARQPVPVETPTAPAPTARPAQGSETGQAANLVTSPAGTVPIATGTAEATTGPATQPEQVASEVAVAAPGEEPAEEPIAEPAPPPPPPPPPPTVASMLSFPGGTYLPKAYTAAWGTVSIRVLLTVDEQGRIIEAHVDPAMRSADDLINQEALIYARQFVEAKPGPDGQAYRASVVVTFGQQGTTFAADPDERIDLVGSGG